MTNLPVKLHASLGASNCQRWWNCPGSVRLAATLPPPPDTDHSREGTCAHGVAQLALTKGVDPTAYLGTTVEGWVVDDGMAEFLPAFVEYCRALMPRASLYGIEEQFSLASLKPPAAMFGTADFWAYVEDDFALEIVDLKYGIGVVVDPKDNKQLLYYALGALIRLLEQRPQARVDTIRLTIVQPRVDAAPKWFDITYLELLAFAHELMDHARAAQAPDAPLTAGAWCRFCPASGQCSEQYRYAQETAMVEFAETPLDNPPDPATLTPEVFGRVLSRLGDLEQFISGVRAAAYAKLERGEALPGWKLVQRRANRKWVDEAHTRQWLEALGQKGEAILLERLRSPAQIEKLVGKKNLPSEMTVKESSGLALVPDRDARPAVEAPDVAFGVLPAALDGAPDA